MKTTVLLIGLWAAPPPPHFPPSLPTLSHHTSLPSLHFTSSPSEPGLSKPLPEFSSRYSLYDDSGQLVASVPQTVIGVALGGQVSRIHALPLRTLSPGRYRLSIEATDRRSGVLLQASDTIVIEPQTATSAAQR